MGLIRYQSPPPPPVFGQYCGRGNDVVGRQSLLHGVSPGPTDSVDCRQSVLITGVIRMISHGQPDDGKDDDEGGRRGLKVPVGYTNFDKNFGTSYLNRFLTVKVHLLLHRCFQQGEGSSTGILQDL